jgi:predicted transcriptional regulator
VPTVDRPPERRHAPRLEHVRVADAMHAGVVTCAADTPLRDVARMLVEHRIHCVAIPDVEVTGVSAWAIVSALDIVGAAAAGSVERLTARDIAASEALAISDDDVLDRAVQLMSEHQVAHLIVVGAASGRPVGVLSTLDVAGLLAWRESG